MGEREYRNRNRLTKITTNYFHEVESATQWRKHSLSNAAGVVGHP